MGKSKRATKLSAEEKTEIVLEGLRGNKTVDEICIEHSISKAQYCRWRDKLFEVAKTALESSGNSSQIAQYQKKVEELEQIIGKQAIVIETLKKRSFILAGSSGSVDRRRIQCIGSSEVFGDKASIHEIRQPKGECQHGEVLQDV